VAGNAVDSFNRYMGALGFFWDEAGNILEASLTLIGIFALRILVLPALLFWGGMTILRRGVRS
jgi:hypothetical protein